MNVEANGENAQSAPVTAPEVPNSDKLWDDLMAALHAKDGSAPELLAKFSQQYPLSYQQRTSLRMFVQGAWAAELWGVAEVPLYGKAIREQARAKQKALAGTAPSELDMALAEQAAEDWTQTQVLAFQAGRQINSAGGSQIHRPLDAAHRRYNRTLKTMAVVRRLSKGLEVRVTHDNASSGTAVEASTLNRPGAAVTAEEQEVSATEGTCLRAGSTASRLRDLMPEGASA